MKLPQLLRERRIKLRLTQDQVAALANTTQNRISEWERGKSKPSVRQILPLAAALQLKPRVLLESATTPTP